MILIRCLAIMALIAALTGCGVNRIPALDEQVKAAWSQVENQYQRRADLVPNLVETVKGFATQERETLQAVVEARSQATSIEMDTEMLSDPEAMERFEQAQRNLGSALQRLMVVVERYPELRSNQNFLALQSQLEGTENRIAVARRDYIQVVQRYNTELRTFPGRIWHTVLYSDLEIRETFEATTPNAEQAPQVGFLMVVRVLLVILLLVALPAVGQEIRFPELTGRVVDGAELLEPETEQAIANKFAAHERATGNQVVVVTLEDLQGRSIEEFGYQLGRHWGIGQEGEDNGALLLIAEQERQVRVEVGYGLEGQLTDAVSSDIINRIILPEFRRGEFSAGIEKGADAMLEALGGEYQLPSGAKPTDARAKALVLFLVFGGWLFLLLITSSGGGPRGGNRLLLLGGLAALGGRGGGFGGGGLGGGGFGGGGGGFGGGGASGGW